MEAPGGQRCPIHWALGLLMSGAADAQKIYEMDEYTMPTLTANFPIPTNPNFEFLSTVTSKSQLKENYLL